MNVALVHISESTHCRHVVIVGGTEYRH